MKEQIKAIREKYGEPMLRMAIDHVIGVGINNLKNVNADEVCAQILKETPANAIMTPEFSAELMRCAIELSRVSIGDILKYIQTDMKYDGVTVHPGIIIRFMQNATGHNIITCVVCHSYFYALNMPKGQATYYQYHFRLSPNFLDRLQRMYVVGREFLDLCRYMVY